MSCIMHHVFKMHNALILSSYMHLSMHTSCRSLQHIILNALHICHSIHIIYIHACMLLSTSNTLFIHASFLICFTYTFLLVTPCPSIMRNNTILFNSTYYCSSVHDINLILCIYLSYSLACTSYRESYSFYST